MIEEILKKLREERDSIDNKLRTGYYSIGESRARYDEIRKVIDNVLEISQKYYTSNEISKIIKEYL